MGVECFFARDELFHELHSLIEEYGLASCNIVISNGNQLVGERYHDFCVQRNQPELVEFVATCGGAWTFAQSLPAPAAVAPFVPVPAPRRRRFVSFNGRARPHRFLLALLMHSLGDLERSTFSLLGYDNARTVDARSPDEQRYGLERLVRRAGLTDELLPHVDAFLARLPLEVDVKVADVGNAEVYAKRLEHGMPDTLWFDQACFHLVSETLFFSHDARFITEKTFKAFAVQNPFVLIAQPGTLGFARSLGLRSCGAAWDESYDDIEDDWQRLAACFAHVRRLSALGDAAAEALVSSLSEAFEHNHRWFATGAFTEAVRRDLRERILPACFEARGGARP